MIGERRVNFYREGICAWRRENVILNLDGYHVYGSKIRKEDVENV